MNLTKLMRNFHRIGSMAKTIRRRKFEALKKQKGRCFYCGIRIRKSEATADHYLPISKGGKDSKKNIVAACHSCNQTKGGMDAIDFMREMREPLTRGDSTGSGHYETPDLSAEIGIT